MVKSKMLIIRITEAQEELLSSRAQELGLSGKSEYARIKLFMKK
jgi:hypothetical protein